MKKNRDHFRRAAAFSAALLLLSGCTNKVEYPEGVDTLPTYSATGQVVTVYDTSVHTTEETTTTTTVTTTTPTTTEATTTTTTTAATTAETSVCETVPETSYGLSIEDVPDVGISEYYDNTQTKPTLTEYMPPAVTQTGIASDMPTDAVTSVPDTVSDTVASVSTAASADINSNIKDLDDRLKDGRKSPYTGKTMISHPYSYYTLDDKHKGFYDKIVNAMLKRQDHVDFKVTEKCTFDDLFNTYQLLYNDENRLFYISSSLEYVIDPENDYVTQLRISYLYSDDEIVEMQKNLDDTTKKIMSGLNPQMNDYEIVKYFHDYIITHCTYDEKCERPNNIYGTLVDQKSLCQGYSQSFTYLCSLAGLDSFIVLGVANEPHMWNIVKMDGDYYHVDLTWDDPDRPKNPDSVRYDYFGLTDERIRELRQFDDYDYEIPKAEGTKYQYYSYNKLVVSSIDEAKKVLADEIIKASETKSSTVQIMCSDTKVFNELTELLFGNSAGNVIGILNSVKTKVKNGFNTESVYHNSNSSTRTIRIFLDYLD